MTAAQAISHANAWRPEFVDRRLILRSRSTFPELRYIGDRTRGVMNAALADAIGLPVASRWPRQIRAPGDHDRRPHDLQDRRLPTLGHGPALTVHDPIHRQVHPPAVLTPPSALAISGDRHAAWQTEHSVSSTARSRKLALV